MKDTEIIIKEDCEMLSSVPWTENQHKLHDLFKKQAPHLLDAYIGALTLIGTRSFPGRIYFIAHAARDICNRLPDIFLTIENSKIGYEEKLDEIAKVWPDTNVKASDYAPRPDIDTDMTVSIPISVAMKILTLLDKNKNRRTQFNKFDDMFALLAGADEQERKLLQPIVKEFKDVADWFMKHTHLRNKAMPDVPQCEIEQKFEHFESLVCTLLKGFFETKDDINEILQQANATTD